MITRHLISTLFPYTTLFRSYSFGFQYEVFKGVLLEATYSGSQTHNLQASKNINALTSEQLALGTAYLNAGLANPLDRKSTRLNSSHANISYAVFCLKKKKRE